MTSQTSLGTRTFCPTVNRKGTTTWPGRVARVARPVRCMARNRGRTLERAYNIPVPISAPMTSKTQVESSELSFQSQDSSSSSSLAPQVAELEEPPSPKKDLTGYLNLLACAVLLGTYNPVLKIIFAEEHPMDPATLTALRTVIAAAAMGVAIAFKPRTAEITADLPQQSAGENSKSGSQDALLAEDIPLEELSSDTTGKGDAPRERSLIENGLILAALGGIMAAGVELGFYLFVEVSTESVGLQLTSATRAGFLTQSAGVLTPVLSYLAGERISLQMWGAVASGLLGSCLVAYGGIASETAEAAAYPEELKGVVLLLTASLAISLATIRLGTLASKFCAVDLAAIRQITLGAISVIWFLGQHHQGLTPGLSIPEQAAALGLTGRSMGSWALIIYSALGPGALATYLQTKGQGSVPATPSQLIHSTTPIWSALIAMGFMLGGESMGPWSWAGGVAVLGASLLAATEH